MINIHSTVLLSKIYRNQIYALFNYHYRHTESMSEVASCSYTARQVRVIKV